MPVQLPSAPAATSHPCQSHQHCVHPSINPSIHHSHNPSFHPSNPSIHRGIICSNLPLSSLKTLPVPVNTQSTAEGRKSSEG